MIDFVGKIIKTGNSFRISVPELIVQAANLKVKDKVQVRLEKIKEG